MTIIIIIVVIIVHVILLVTHDQWRPISVAKGEERCTVQQ